MEARKIAVEVLKPSFLFCSVLFCVECSCRSGGATCPNNHAEVKRKCDEEECRGPSTDREDRCSST